MRISVSVRNAEIRRGKAGEVVGATEFAATGLASFRDMPGAKDALGRPRASQRDAQRECGGRNGITCAVAV